MNYREGVAGFTNQQGEGIPRKEQVHSTRTRASAKFSSMRLFHTTVRPGSSIDKKQCFLIKMTRVNVFKWAICDLLPTCNRVKYKCSMLTNKSVWDTVSGQNPTGQKPIGQYPSGQNPRRTNPQGDKIPWGQTHRDIGRQVHMLAEALLCGSTALERLQFSGTGKGCSWCHHYDTFVRLSKWEGGGADVDVMRHD